MKPYLPLALLGLGCLYGAGLPQKATPTKPRPNIIVIQGEGHGWASLPIPMDPERPTAKNTNVEMPGFVRLATEGMRFTQFYSASPRCTPSRAALLTGKTPAQLHMTFVNEGRRDGDVGNTKLRAPITTTELAESEKTLPELLQEAGYSTAHFGKWHVGRANPARHGFPLNDGANNNGGPDNDPDPSTVQTPLTGKKSAEFVSEQLKQGKPFYLQLDQYASKADEAQEALDKVLQNLFAALKEGHGETNTYIFYTTDHGTPGRNFPLRGGKGHLLEGGIRVPFLAWGPGIRAGSISKVPACGIDLLPTACSLAGVTKLPEGVEGGSLKEVLMAGGLGAVKRPRAGLYFHFPHYDFDNGGPASAVVLGNEKLLRTYETDSRQLYDIVKDPGERTDLAKERPERVAELDRRLTEWLTAVKASQAEPNPSYDPTRPAETNVRRGGKGGGGGGRRRNGWGIL